MRGLFMLGFTAAENTTMRARSVVGDPPPIVLPEPRLVIISDRIERPQHAAARRPSQDQRRAVGLGLLALTLALDGLAVLLWLRVLVGPSPARGARFFGLVYMAVALLLLLPTYRRGRVVARPSELVIQISTRVALAPVLTAMISLAL